MEQGHRTLAMEQGILVMLQPRHYVALLQMVVQLVLAKDAQWAPRQAPLEMEVLKERVLVGPINAAAQENVKQPVKFQAKSIYFKLLNIYPTILKHGLIIMGTNRQKF